MLHEEAEHVDLVGSQLVKVAAVLVGALQLNKCIHHFYYYKSVFRITGGAGFIKPSHLRNLSQFNLTTRDRNTPLPVDPPA